jgi:TPR repeat protein
MLRISFFALLITSSLAFAISADLVKRAKDGDDKAQFALASAYHLGDGVEKDDRLAFYWYRQVAIKGYANAQFNIANSYYHGIGVEKDTKKAIIWYEKAAKQNNTKAISNLANIYTQQGEFAKAVPLHTKLASAGDKSSQEKLANYWQQKVGKNNKKNDSQQIIAKDKKILKLQQQKQDDLKIINNLNAKIEYTKQQLNQEQQQSAKLKEQLQILSQKHTKSTDNLQQLTTNNNQVTAKLKQQIANKDKELAQLKQQGQDNSQTNKDLIAKLQLSQQKNTKSAIKLTKLQQNNQNLEKNIKQNQQELTSKQQIIDELQQKLQDNTKQIAKTKELKQEIVQESSKSIIDYATAVMLLSDNNKSNDNKALQFITQLADNNNPKAQNHLANLYIQGKVITKNYQQAYYYAMSAWQNGYSDAKNTLKLLQEIDNKH